MNQGTKNRFFRQIFHRKIGFRAGSIEIFMEKIGNKKIGKKSGFFGENRKIRYFADFFGVCAARAWERVRGEKVGDLSPIN